MRAWMLLRSGVGSAWRRCGCVCIAGGRKGSGVDWRRALIMLRIGVPRDDFLLLRFCCCRLSAAAAPPLPCCRRAWMPSRSGVGSAVRLALLMERATAGEEAAAATVDAGESA